jgi:hypothetical protein
LVTLAELRLPAESAAKSGNIPICVTLLLPTSHFLQGLINRWDEFHELVQPLDDELAQRVRFGNQPNSVG